MKWKESGNEMIKNGMNPSGSQKYLCKKCKWVTTPNPQPRGYSEEIKQKAINMVLDGAGFRFVAREMDVSDVSVLNWFNAASEGISPILQPNPTGKWNRLNLMSLNVEERKEIVPLDGKRSIRRIVFNPELLEIDLKEIGWD